jgi:hypothetical protein
VTRFDAARRAALVQDLLGVLKGRPVDLLPFDRVRAGLRLKHIVDRGIHDVPLESIVGTLGREREFNREFLPRDEALRDRWEEVEELAEGPAGFQPVELYKVGETYFVVDGHHRVSVARSLGVPSIEALVKEFLTPVPISPDASIEDVMLQRGLADFLETTGLVPEGTDEFRVTEADGYERLLEHITVHRYYRGVETGREQTWPEAVTSWRDTVYRPMVETIRRSGIMEEFPKRTETDLYLFTMDHLHHLRERYAPKPVAPTLAVRHFKFFYKAGPGLGERLRSWWRRFRSG